jgi:hypothetical protein
MSSDVAVPLIAAFVASILTIVERDQARREDERRLRDAKRERLREDYVSVVLAAETIGSVAKQLMLLERGDKPEARAERLQRQLEVATEDCWESTGCPEPSQFPFPFLPVVGNHRPSCSALKTLAILCAASINASTSGCPYTSAVIATDACPSCLLTMSSLTPPECAFWNHDRRHAAMLVTWLNGLPQAEPNGPTFLLRATGV